MILDNDRLRRALGVTAWHQAGYTGNGVRAASGERWDGGSDTHGWKSLQTFREVAPDAEVVCLPWEGVVNDAFGLEVTAGVKTRGVSVFWASVASAFRLPAAAEARFAALTDRCVFMLAGGNKNSQNEGARAIESPSLWGVNACMCMADGRINPAYYNFNSKHIDFCAPEGWTLPAGGRFTGTSAATPALAGMAACVQQMAYEQLHRALSADEMHAFFASCACPVGSAAQCGIGLPVLPDPYTVDLRKYAREGEKDDGSNTGSTPPAGDGHAAAVPDTETMTSGESAWSLAEGGFARATALGIMDGTRPQAPVTREQLAAILLRLGLLDNMA